MAWYKIKRFAMVMEEQEYMIEAPTMADAVGIWEREEEDDVEDERSLVCMGAHKTVPVPGTLTFELDENYVPIGMNNEPDGVIVAEGVFWNRTACDGWFPVGSKVYVEQVDN